MGMYDKEVAKRLVLRPGTLILISVLEKDTRVDFGSH